MKTDLISRQDAINALEWKRAGKAAIDAIKQLPPANRWIPFTVRPCTEQEKEEHPDWSFYIDCQLPDDGEEVLISTKYGNVCEDTIFCDDDCWYLDSGYEIGEDAVAWMPLPEPYKEEDNERV